MLISLYSTADLSPQEGMKSFLCIENNLLGQVGRYPMKFSEVTFVWGSEDS